MWPRPPVAERRDRDPDGRQTRVGYILRRCGFERHCGIVSKICLVKGGRRGEATTLLTASRDATLKCWDFPANETHGGASSSTAPAPPQLRCSLEEHTAWVNDAVVLPPVPGSADASRDSRRVVSASNDNLVKVWHVDEERQGAGVSGALLSLRYHVDYVTCLAYAPHRSLLASAGLDARAVIADLEAATRVLNIPAEDGNGFSGSGHRSGSPHRSSAASVGVAAQRCTVGQFSGTGQYIPQLLASPSAHAASSREGNAHEHGRGNWEQEQATAGSTTSGASVWSIATTRNASLLVCGTASCAVRGWDPRSGIRLFRLRGHTENVRALLLNDDGTICISGSADRTVRVWDVGMRRCIHVFDAHHDSVWALACAGYSCGYPPQGAVDTAGAGGALGEVLSGGRDGLLLSHDLRLMQTALIARDPSPLQAVAVPAEGCDVWASAADSHVRRHVVPTTPVPYGCAAALGDDMVSALPPTVTDDCIVVPGTPRLTDYKVLHNKRQVLVKDACDQLSLWDVTNGQCVDFPAPPPASNTGGSSKDDVMKRALHQINKTVSVPNWFSCDLSLGSLSVYLDVSQCFKAEPDDVDVAMPNGAGTGGRNGSAPRGADSMASAVPVNLGARTLRALFDGWARAPPPAAVGRVGSISGVAERAGGRSASGGPSNYGRQANVHPCVFVAPPTMQETSAGGANRWDDEQPPGTPSDQGGPAELPQGSGAAPAFPPATALVLQGRNGRCAGYRGRLYCGLFNGSEVPELLPPWVVDVVWNQRPPPEELCGERAMMFSLVRCSSELALPALATPFCMAAPRTRIRRLMGYLVRALDFDWSTPAKSAVRRPSSAASLVTRLGRCCVVPTNRGRAASSDSWGSQSDPGDTSGARSNTTRRSRSSSRERSALHNQHSNTPASSSGVRRSLGFRRGEEELPSATCGVAGRVRIDGSPPPLASVPASSPGQGRKGAGASAASPAAGGDALPDERYVEILCHDQPIDPEMSLATVRDFIWKKGNTELVLCYKRAARAVVPSPPPPPPLLPGSSAKEQATNGSSPPAASGAMCDDRSGEAKVGGEIDVDAETNTDAEDVTSELKLNGGSEGAWCGGQDEPSPEVQEMSAAQKE